MGTYVTGDGFVRLRLADISATAKALTDLDPSIGGVTASTPDDVAWLLKQLLPSEQSEVVVNLRDAATYELSIGAYGKCQHEDEAMKTLARFSVFGAVDWRNHDTDQWHRDEMLNGLHRRVEGRVVYDDPNWPLCPRCQAVGFEDLCDTCQMETADEVPERLEALRERLSATAEGEASEPR